MAINESIDNILPDTQGIQQNPNRIKYIYIDHRLTAVWAVLKKGLRPKFAHVLFCFVVSSFFWAVHVFASWFRTPAVILVLNFVSSFKQAVLERGVHRNNNKHWVQRLIVLSGSSSPSDRSASSIIHFRWLASASCHISRGSYTRGVQGP